MAKRKIRRVILPPAPPPLSDHHIEKLVEQIIYGPGEEDSCNALLVLMEEFHIASGLAMDPDRVFAIALLVQTKAFSLEPIEMGARISKIRSRLVRKVSTKRKARR